MKNFHDNGIWMWHYKCKYVFPSNDLKDWYYEVSFQTKDGGHLNDEALSCFYWNAKNDLIISKGDNRLEFYVEKFYDAESIIKSLIKSYKCKVYPIYESKMSEIRKSRLDKLNKIKNIYGFNRL